MNVDVYATKRETYTCVICAPVFLFLIQLEDVEKSEYKMTRVLDMCASMVKRIAQN